MTGTATRYLYLVRHGEASPDESRLTEAGRRQATLLGQRLRDVPLAAVHHGPLPRAEQTARLIGDQLKSVPRHVSEAAGDYLPYMRKRANFRPNRQTSPSASSPAPRTRSGKAELRWPVRRWICSPGRWTANRIGTNWSSPTTSWSPGSSGMPCMLRSGDGSASTTATRHSTSSAMPPAGPRPSLSPTTCGICPTHCDGRAFPPSCTSDGAGQAIAAAGWRTASSAASTASNSGAAWPRDAFTGGTPERKLRTPAPAGRPAVPPSRGPGLTRVAAVRAGVPRSRRCHG